MRVTRIDPSGDRTTNDLSHAQAGAEIAAARARGRTSIVADDTNDVWVTFAPDSEPSIDDVLFPIPLPVWVERVNRIANQIQSKENPK